MLLDKTVLETKNVHKKAKKRDQIVVKRVL